MKCIPIVVSYLKVLQLGVSNLLQCFIQSNLETGLKVTESSPNLKMKNCLLKFFGAWPNVGLLAVIKMQIKDSKVWKSGFIRRVVTWRATCFRTKHKYLLTKERARGWNWWSKPIQDIRRSSKGSEIRDLIITFFHKEVKNNYGVILHICEIGFQYISHWESPSLLTDKERIIHFYSILKRVLLR